MKTFLALSVVVVLSSALSGCGFIAETLINSAIDGPINHAIGKSYYEEAKSEAKRGQRQAAAQDWITASQYDPQYWSKPVLSKSESQGAMQYWMIMQNAPQYPSDPANPRSQWHR